MGCSCGAAEKVANLHPKIKCGVIVTDYCTEYHMILISLMCPGYPTLMGMLLTACLGGVAEVVPGESYRAECSF